MTKQQQSRLTETAEEKGIIPMQTMEWEEACMFAIAYHASFDRKHRRSRAKEETHDMVLYKALVDIWLKEVHPGWSFASVDGKAVKTIMEKMRLYVANPRNNLVVPIDGGLLEYHKNFFRHFCKKLPEFYRSQTLMVLANKFDSIIEEIKTQNGKKRIARPSERLSDFAGQNA